MDYFVTLDTSVLESIDWIMVSKVTKEDLSGDNADKVLAVMNFQSAKPHGCPICEQTHKTSISSTALIAKNAEDGEARRLVNEAWGDAVALMLKINARISEMENFQFKGETRVESEDSGSN